MTVAANRTAIGTIARRVLRAVEPFYDWGPINVTNMDARTAAEVVEGDVRYFDLQWFGIHIGLQFGRTPKREG